MIDDPLKVGFLLNPSRAGEGFHVCLISLVVMEFCSLKKLRLCFSTDQGSENPLVYRNLTVFGSDQYFSGLGEGFIGLLISLVLMEFCSQTYF